MKFSTSPTIGCIGCGNMGGAILGGLAKNGTQQLVGYNHSAERVSKLGGSVKSAASARALAEACDVIIIAVKPYVVASVLTEIQPAITADKLLISVAAGVSIAQIRGLVGGTCPVVRTMPNTPALVGMGVFALCFDDPSLTDAHKSFTKDMFSKIGTPLELHEKQIVAFTSLVGAGPAYVFYLMDALVQAGVTLGFPAHEATHLVGALFAGSVRMAQESPHNLAALREQVCSPAGVTIEGVNHMDRTAVRGHIIDAVLAVDARGHAMEKD